MAKACDIQNDPKFTRILDHGFIGLVDHLGSDSLVERSARISYGEQTRSVSDTKNLIRYLFRHQHTSPFEMPTFIWHVKAPIFVARQWFRHRMASYNEVSARYSVLPDEVYVPDHFSSQSNANKQCSGDKIDDQLNTDLKKILTDAYDVSRNAYEHLISSGVSREQARIIMPVGQYTEFYVKNDLSNLFKFLALRIHPHAQHEIRVYAEAMLKAISPIVPICAEAFHDYALSSIKINEVEAIILGVILASPYNDSNVNDEKILMVLTEIAQDRRLKIGKRELNELVDKYRKLSYRNAIITN